MNLSRTAAAALLAFPLMAPPGFARPLATELQTLMAEHPLIKSGRKSLESTDKSRDAARAGYYPRVVVSGDAGPEKITSRSYVAGTTTPPSGSELSRRKVGVSVEQNLFAGGRTRAAVEVASIDQELQGNSLQNTTQEVLLEGLSAYIQMSRFLTLVSLANRNEETTRRQLELESARVERGGGIAVDAMQARARLQLVKERRVFYGQGLREAAANYQQVFGREPDVASLQQLGIFYDRIPKTLEQALALANELSPRPKEAQLQSKRALAQIKAESSAYAPSVDLVATQTNDTNVNALAKRDESSLLLRVTWPLFTGFETRNRVAAANLNHQAVVEREAAVNNRQAEAVRVAWNQLVNGREREELLESAASISFDVMQSRKRLRDAGRETVIGVLDAEVEYYGAVANRVNAMNDSMLASYRLLAAIGALTPAAVGIEDGRLVLPVKPFNPDAGSLVGAVLPAPPTAVPALAAQGAGTAPGTASVTSVEPSPRPSAEAAGPAQRLGDWAAAWQSGDAERYLSFYAADFKPSQGSLAAWKLKRRSLVGKAGPIVVQLRDAKTRVVDADTAETSFTQAYRSPRFSDVTQKRLTWVRQGKTWYIAREEQARPQP